MCQLITLAVDHSQKKIAGSGEARTLKKEISRLVSTGDERPRNLKLMVVHKNSDILLADVLGATDEITLLYYHNANRFRYQGRLHGRSIVSSVFYLMSFQPEEVPLEFLSNENELKSFMQSTDEAVFLVELCGWSSRLLHPRDGMLPKHNADLLFVTFPVIYFHYGIF